MSVWELDPVRRGLTAQLASLDRTLASGAVLLGWKVGVGAPASMARAGIPAPLVGYLTSATALPDGAEVAVHDWKQPMLEPELAVHLGADIPPDADRDMLRSAVAGIGPAIELADVDVPLDDLEAVVAGDVYHRHVILGDADHSRRGDDLEDLRIEVAQGGEQVATTASPTELTGDPLDLVAHVAAWLAAAGRRLTGGQVVILGSTVPIIPVSPGRHLTYRCAPLGTLSVSLTGQEDDPADQSAR